MRKESITEEDISPTIVCKMPWRLIMVKALEEYRLEVTFFDGTQGFVDMKQLIMSPKAGIFAKLKNHDNFNQVYLSYGVATWPDEIDLAPDVMYDEIKKHGQWIL